MSNDCILQTEQQNSDNIVASNDNRCFVFDVVESCEQWKMMLLSEKEMKANQQYESIVLCQIKWTDI